MCGAFLQDCILPLLKYFISKHNWNFYNYTLMIEIIYIIPLKKACHMELVSWPPRSPIIPPSGQYVELQTHDPWDPQKVGCPVSAVKNDWKWQ